MFEGNFIIALLLTLFAGMATGIGGPGAAWMFGFAILEKFAGAEKVAEVKKGMLIA